MIKVTRKQMDTINQCKEFQGTYNLKFITDCIVKGDDFLTWAQPLNGMTVEQIVLAWHGHVEVEPNFVSFDEAMKARKEGFIVSFHHSAKQVIIGPFKINILKDGMLGHFTLDELLDGKWTVE